MASGWADGSAGQGADLTVLLATVRRHGVVRLFSTTIHGELGNDTEVEISAAGSSETDPKHISVLLRDVGRRLIPRIDRQGLEPVLLSLTEKIGKTTLQKLVKATVGVVERHYVEAALELTAGNRTAAAGARASAARASTQSLIGME